MKSVCRNYQLGTGINRSKQLAEMAVKVPVLFRESGLQRARPYQPVLAREMETELNSRLHLDSLMMASQFAPGEITTNSRTPYLQPAHQRSHTVTTTSTPSGLNSYLNKD